MKGFVKALGNKCVLAHVTVSCLEQLYFLSFFNMMSHLIITIAFKTVKLAQNPLVIIQVLLSLYQDNSSGQNKLLYLFLLLLSVLK
jgi:hypothetical protein